MKKLAKGSVGTGSGTLLYTVPTGFHCNLMDICIANTAATANGITLHLVPAGQSPSAATQMFPSATLDANSLVQWTGLQTLNPGDYIQGIGSSSGVTVHISGEEYR